MRLAELYTRPGEAQIIKLKFVQDGIPNFFVRCSAN